MLVDVAVHLARGEQLIIGALGRDASIVQHDDLVGQRDRRETVGDDQCGPVAHRLAQSDPDTRFGRGVDRSRCVVEDQHTRIDRERPGDCEALTLPARECDAALADNGVVAVRQLIDELVRLREPGNALHFGIVQIGRAEHDVLAHGGREQERIL